MDSHLNLELENLKKELEEKKELILSQADELKSLDQIKSRFFTNISHEFRTPLSVVSGMSQTLLESEDEKTRKIGRSIFNNANSLLNLINQLLDLVKMEAGKFEFKPQQADIILFIRQIIDSVLPLAETKDIDISLKSSSDSFLVDFDQDKLFNVLSNLITNAIKFTDVSGSVKIKLERKDDQLIIIITDSGIGISAHKLPFIFDRFFQADHSRIYVEHGTGVGLNFVKELVELMGGDISVESEENVGSTFTISLPISNKEAIIITSPRYIVTDINDDDLELSKLEEENQNKSNLPSLLLIEDNKDILRMLKIIFDSDYQLHFATNGQEGIDKALEIIPDIVISDVMMPVKDGIEVLNTLKSHDFTSHIPIILLTAKADIDSKMEGLKRGADDYVSKPFNNEELKLRVINMLESKRRIHSRYSDLMTDVPVEESEFHLEDKFINSIQEVLNQNLDDSEFGIADFCSELAISRMQLHNKLKAITGLSTSAFISGLRLHKAKEMIEHSDLGISEIGYAVGFSSHSYFSKKFLEKYDLTPKSLREVNNTV